MKYVLVLVLVVVVIYWWRGLRDAAPRVALWAGGISLLLEAARGERLP